MSPLKPIFEPQPASAAVMARRQVRVLSKRDNGFIEFEFSIGWPELAVELMMTEEDFLDFCKAQSIQPSEY
ncbi:phenol hydroxylase subunit [Eoetvoesiella caeni]|uniref:Phenol hydroxylase P0 protein n=1 Tax=Eoetvoesiella caeni TaxID=645616 RepID=A0A366H5U7_9BURK|nr:phenol hydroxylase subunit [Eoetvoesiella caeni]MCI2810646.1 phenol hydroxylase subunit [Eoetvoesiella caeni]NYT56570.1 phenol hydroxylase [Eoetvoesiella caeni]RBP36269.1 phenol hydroxylase P0 protein [Eoetvoesiella caeni]